MFWTRSALVPGDAGGDLGRVAQGLQYDTVTLGQFQQGIDAILRLVGVELEGEADRAKADRRGSLHPQSAAEIEVALGLEAAAVEAEFERGGDRLQRYPGAGDERLQQHVAG